MRVNLNLTDPTIVLPGAWNVAIFSPEWITRYLYGYEAGTDVEVTLLHNITLNKQILMIDGIGLSPQPTRIEIFVRSVDIFPKLDVYVERIYEHLPHTPCGSFGINFKYLSDEVSPDVVAKLETSEGLEAEYEIRRQELKTQLVVESDVFLNLTRVYEPGGMMIDFNFHFAIRSKDAIIEKLKGNKVQECRGIAEALMQSHYDVDDISVAGFDQETQEQ